MIRLPICIARSLNESRSCIANALRVLNSHPKLSLQQKREFSITLSRCVNSFGESAPLCVLASRGVLRLSGQDTPALLQGLVTSDIEQLMEQSPNLQYCMMLNVQGRVLYDLFLYNVTESPNSAATVFVDVDTEVKEELVKLFRRYKLRKKVDISDVSSEYTVLAQWGREDKEKAEDSSQIFSFHDPRVPMFANRILASSQTCPATESEEAEKSYRVHRYQWGIPEGVSDLPPGDCLPLESNLSLMNGVSFQKGCYIGQELTARTFHTGVTRKRIMPISLNRDVPIPPNTTISTDKGRNAGKFRSSEGLLGLGLLRLAQVKGSLSVIGQDGQETSLNAQVPSWWPPSIMSSGN